MMEMRNGNEMNDFHMSQLQLNCELQTYHLCDKQYIKIIEH